MDISSPPAVVVALVDVLVGIVMGVVANVDVVFVVVPVVVAHLVTALRLPRGLLRIVCEFLVVLQTSLPRSLITPMGIPFVAPIITSLRPLLSLHPFCSFSPVLEVGALMFVGGLRLFLVADIVDVGSKFGDVLILVAVEVAVGVLATCQASQLF